MHRIMQVAIPLVVCIVIMFVLKSFLFGSTTVTISKKTAGMRPAIGKDKERFTIAASPRARKQIKQGDIVAYQLPRKGVFAARVIAAAGQRVSIESGKIKVDGKSYSAPGAKGNRNLNQLEIRVPRDCLYLIADRTGSEPDSSKSGPIARRMVLGKLLLSE